MSRNIAKITGKMPLVGKHMVEYWYRKGREASRNGEMMGKLTNAAALGAVAVLHAMQMGMGVDELMRDGDQNPVAVGIDALFTTVNARVAYTQAYLAIKVMTTSPRPPKMPAMTTPDGVIFSTGDAEHAKKSKIEAGDPSLFEFASTAAGQALFLVTMH